MGLDGAPVAGATVYLREWAYLRQKQQPDQAPPSDILARTTTDAQGRFAFREISPPKPAIAEAAGPLAYPWDIVVTASGHGLAWQRLPARNPSRPLTLTLAPEAHLRGRLLDAAGKPAAGVRLEVAALQPLDQAPPAARHSPGYLSLHGSQISLAVVSDREGQVALGGLPGNVRVALVVADERFARQTVYAATTDVAQSSVVVERAPAPDGSVRARWEPVHTGDFVVTLPPARRLRVRVVFESTGKPVAGARLEGLEGPTHLPEKPVADAEGRLTIARLAAGKYTLLVAATQESSVLGASAPVTVAAGNEETALTVILRPGVVVTGQVLEEETGKGIPGVPIAYKALPAATAEARPLASPTRTGPDGRFRMVLPPGKGWVGLPAAVPGYVMTGLSANSPQIREGPFLRRVDVRPGQPPVAVEFSLSQGLTVTLHLLDLDGKPVAGAEVSGLTSDDQGRVTLRGLDPQQSHELVVTHPERLLAARTVVPPSSDKKPLTLEVRLQVMGSAAGRVLDDAKKPLGRAAVQLLQWSPATTGKMTFFSTKPVDAGTADRDGRFTVERLVPGTRYTVTASVPGYATVGYQLEAKTGPPQSLPDLLLPRADQVVAGVVVDPRGQPLAGVRLTGSVPVPETAPLGLRITNTWQGYTGRDGRFRFTGLPRGPIHLTAYRPAGTDASGQKVLLPTSVRAQAGTEDVKIILAESPKPDAVGPAVGQPAPAFALRQWVNAKDLPAKDGFSAKTFAGRVVVLAFLNEARPSQRLLSRLNQLHEKLAAKGLAIVRVYERGAAPEDPAKGSPTAAALVEPGLLPGGYSEAFQKYRVRAAPTVFLLDRAGVLRYVDVDLDALEERLGELLKK